MPYWVAKFHFEITELIVPELISFYLCTVMWINEDFSPDANPEFDTFWAPKFPSELSELTGLINFTFCI